MSTDKSRKYAFSYTIFTAMAISIIIIASSLVMSSATARSKSEQIKYCQKWKQVYPGAKGVKKYRECIKRDTFFKWNKREEQPKYRKDKDPM